MPDPLPTGTVTFLYTDIEGSVSLWEREPEPMRAAQQRHDAILQNAIAAHGGVVYKIIGDAFQAAFAVSAQALAAALAAQRHLAAEAWPTSAPLRARMGLHAGQAEAHEGDYVPTHTLNRVARIMSAGHGGQILLSETVAELARGDWPSGVTLRDLGQHRMKGMAQPEHLFQVVAPDLPADFPPLKTLGGSPNNLPTQLTTFIGREAEVAQVKRLLSQSRLVTLTGSGGCGKTRLAIQVAGELQAGYPHGVWLVELAPLADPALAPQTVAAALGLREEGRRPMLAVLTDFLRARTLLLVLDNCEHLIEACAQLAESLLRACPTLRILASSREALGIAGEAPYRVPSLAMPDPAHLPAPEALSRMDAVRLFVERATAARTGFALTAQNAPAVTQICKRLDGLPLAIELAAARLKVLSVDEIALRLDDRFRLLTGGSRTALPRQQTLRAMMDWSYSLLPEQERTVFRRLAAFVGGWTLEAAEAVCAETDGGRTTEDEGSSRHAKPSIALRPSEVLDLLTRLVDKSLVMAEELPDETRYRRLETIRQYSREKLLDTDEVEAVRDRHLNFYLQYAETAEMNLQGRERAAWMRRLEAEQENLRAALEWGLAWEPDGALRIAGALVSFWASGGYAVEGHIWTQRALARVEALPPLSAEAGPHRLAARAKALTGLALLSVSQGDNLAGQNWAEESVALYRQSDDRRGRALALALLAQSHEFLGHGAQAETLLQESVTLARVERDAFVAGRALNALARVTATVHGDFDTARRYVEEALRLSREAGLLYRTAGSMGMLGEIAALRHDYAEARSRFDEAILAFRELGAAYNVMVVQSELAHLERRQGHPARALELYRDTIAFFHEAGQRGAVAHQLECFAFIAGAREHFSRAVRLLGAADALRESAGTPMTPDERPEFEQHRDAMRERMDPGAFTAAWAEGRTMNVEQAIQYATEVVSV